MGPSPKPLENYVTHQGPRHYTLLFTLCSRSYMSPNALHRQSQCQLILCITQAQPLDSRERIQLCNPPRLPGLTFVVHTLFKELYVSEHCSTGKVSEFAGEWHEREVTGMWFHTYQRSYSSVKLPPQNILGGTIAVLLLCKESEINQKVGCHPSSYKIA